jgi:hypothetical protein
VITILLLKPVGFCVMVQKQDNVCVWYCGSCCGCGLKKIVLEKALLVEVSLKK